MKQYIAVVLVFLVAAFSAPIHGAAQDRAVADSALLEETESQLPQRGSALLKSDVSVQPPIAVPSDSVSSSYFRDIPSISGRYSIGGRALLPYLGAGFSGGYISELNRSLGATPLTQSDFGIRNQFGPSVSPNEFQLGLRIPF